MAEKLSIEPPPEGQPDTISNYKIAVKLCIVYRNPGIVSHAGISALFFLPIESNPGLPHDKRGYSPLY